MVTIAKVLPEVGRERSGHEFLVAGQYLIENILEKQGRTIVGLLWPAKVIDNEAGCNKRGAPLYLWVDDLEDEAMEQAKNLANLPFASPYCS